MQREAVKQMLQSYREDKARCQYLENEIPQLEKMADALRSEMIDDAVSITQAISDMPRGTSVSDPTGKLGALFAAGYTPEHIRQVEMQIRAKKRELANKLITVTLVDSAMGGLTDRERFIIQGKFIDGMFWRELIEAYKGTFAMLYSKTALRKISDAAIDKMSRIME